MSCYFCLLDLTYGECDVISLYSMYCPVNGSLCCVSGSVCEMFGDRVAECGWGVLCWIACLWSSKECACDPSVHLDAPSICVVCVCWKLSPHLRV